jgi:hypothetical protein
MEAQKAIDAVAAAQKCVDEVLRTEEEHGRLEAMAAQVREEWSRRTKGRGRSVSNCEGMTCWNAPWRRGRRPGREQPLQRGQGGRLRRNRLRRLPNAWRRRSAVPPSLSPLPKPWR